MADRDAQFATDFIGFQFEKFAHHENPGCPFRQVIEADFEDGPEALLAQALFRVAPAEGPVFRAPMGVGLEQRIEAGIERRIVVAQGGDIGRAALGTDQIDDLVAQDGKDPGLQRRAPGKTAPAGQGGEQRLLHGILGLRRIAQLQLREPQHVAAYGSHEIIVDQGVFGHVIGSPAACWEACPAQRRRRAVLIQASSDSLPGPSRSSGSSIPMNNTGSLKLPCPLSVNT